MTILYISNIDQRVTRSILYELFFHVTTIKKLVYPSDATNTPLGYAILEVKENVEIIDYIINLKLKLYNKEIKIAPYKKSNIQLYVNNIKNIDSTTLYNIFNKFGPCTIKKEENKTFAFIEFNNMANAKEAIKFTNKKIINNVEIEVNFSERQLKRLKDNIK